MDLLATLTAMSLSSSASFFEKSAWNHRFANLGAAFYTELAPEPMPSPHWVSISPGTTQMLGWPAQWWQDPTALSTFSGGTCWPGLRPLASVYSGHQFGIWAGQLGDGRALYLGEVQTPDGPFELQLKGAGQTPYSRGADGRAVLRSSIREFLCAEAMAALGIPTTRSLCLTGSALGVHREVIETAAVLTRVAPSFIRFGHFEHFASREQFLELKILADFVIANHAPECTQAPAPYLALLEWVTRRTAALIAQWQAVGFCHGVMNTDNMSILGLTIDYGPFGFLDSFDPSHVCNHSDHQGRYAYDQQPGIAFWNLYALGQAMMPLIKDADAAIAALELFKTEYTRLSMRQWRAKLGLQNIEADDLELSQELLQLLARDRVDFTIFFRRLAHFDRHVVAGNHPLRDMFAHREAFDGWAQRYKARLQREPEVCDSTRAKQMNRCNPRVVLRNHLAEVAIQSAQQGDFGEIAQLLKVLARPFDDNVPGVSPEATTRYAGFPPDWATHLEVSCSS